MDNPKLESLIEYLHAALETIYELKSKNSTYDNETSATTSSIYMRTGTLYPWYELKKWYNRHNYTPKHICRYGIKTNSYPASAWKECFNIDLDALPESSLL